MTTDRCERTDLFVDQCAHCRGNDQTVEEQADAERLKIRRRLAKDPRWSPAQYAGRCTCGQTFAVGTLIHRSTTDPTDSWAVGWTAECCANDQEPTETPPSSHQEPRT